MADWFTAHFGLTQGRISPSNFAASLDEDGNVVDGTSAELLSASSEPFDFDAGSEFHIIVDRGAEQIVVIDDDDFVDIDNATAAEVATLLQSEIPFAKAVPSEFGPYVLVDGDTLLVRIDGGAEQLVKLEAADFVDIGTATADEIAAVITNDLSGGDAVGRGGRPIIRSLTVGTDGTVQITGGSARTKIGYGSAVVTGSNSVSATDESGQVKIVTEKVGAEGCLQVRDPSFDNANQVLNFPLDEVCGTTGSFTFVLGNDFEDIVVPLTGGDSISVAQTEDYDSTDIVRVFGFFRFVQPADSNYRWVLRATANGFDIDIGTDFGDVNGVSLVDLALNVSQIGASDTLSFELLLDGPATETEVELPAAYLDIVDFEVGAADILLGNRLPVPDMVDVPIGLDTIQLHVISTSGSAVDLSNTQVFVDGALAYDGSSGGFQGSFSGTATANSGPSSLDAIFSIDVTSLTFTSEQVVDVQVVSQTLAVETLDETYSFTVQDLTEPQVVTASAQNKSTVRVTFDEPMKMTNASSSDDALNPDNYSFARLSEPAVALEAVSITRVTDTVVDVETNFIHSFGASYQVTVENATDTSGNVLAGNNTAPFLGFVPMIPAGRNFDLKNFLPDHNFKIDASHDLTDFLELLQDVVNVVLCLVDRWTDILDPDLADEAFIDAMLCDLGNPFRFDLTETEKRLLLAVLIPIYQSKGTAFGIIDSVFFFLGIEIAINPLSAFDGWVLGESELGVDTTLHPAQDSLLYSFEIVSPVTLTEVERSRMLTIADYMKPGHEHIIRIVEPETPLEQEVWILGESDLGEGTVLAQIV